MIGTVTLLTMLTMLSQAGAAETNTDLRTTPTDLIIPAEDMTIPATTVLHWKGRFHIEGFSFKGAVPGELYFGPNEQLHFQLLRPSGLPIMSLTVLEKEVCMLFDLDGVQYRGSHEDFNALSKGALPADSLHAIFNPNKSIQPEGWDWYSTPRIPIRALDIDNEDGDLLNAGYKGWRRKDVERGPGRLYVHLGPNDWTLRANIQRRNTRPWTATCEVDDTIDVRPISQMLEALPK